ncbi:MAG: oxidoreductase [Planctomycetota bacterium]|nr:MAG: oxidoreductase [Planctomycetota bacterium]
MSNPYSPVRATLEDVIDETPNIKTFVLKPEREMPFKTGQFIEMTVPGFGEAPFTPSSSPAVTDRMEVTVMRAGTVTELLHKAQPGAVLGLRGPFGKGYPVEEFEGKEILIVGGGVGLAPLRSLLFALFNEMEKFRRVILCYGARTPADIVYKNQLKEWSEREKTEVLLTVDEGDGEWKGNVGVVTTLLKQVTVDIPNAVAVACGPPIMMKFTVLELQHMGFGDDRIYLSMEKNMSCGIGKCGHCRIGSFYVCKDGPVFTYEQLKEFRNIWD